jgi:anti-anti-sigma factor
MEILETREGAVTVIRPIGPLVQSDADEFRSFMLPAIERCFGRLVVDISGVTYLDSKGLEALADASDRMNSAGQTLRLCSANDTVRESLEVTGLAPQFEHCADVPTGVRSFL